MMLVADPVLQKTDQPFLADRSKEVLDVGVNYPVHSPLLDRCAERVQCIVRPSAGPKPVGETAEVS